MTFTTLISADQLVQFLDDPNWVIVDCRFTLDDTQVGWQDYLKSHIPGARYAHLDEDLSGEIIPGVTGRHPLPPVADLAATFSRWGIDERAQVVAYDDQTGGIAARLWWLLRWLGHEAVALLDGGWAAWNQAGLPAESELPAPAARNFTPRPRPELLLEADQVLAWSQDQRHRLIDSRALERYRGEVEPLDAVAGHIPGALCLPYLDNLTEDGHFLSIESLRERFHGILGDTPPAQAVFYCGSGVSAAHNLLALVHAGLGEARLYAGSWSEWITNPERPTKKAN